MAFDYFPPWLARIRKDPFGPAGFARLLIDRPHWNELAFAQEHILQNGTSVGTAGEHNAPEIPREVGSIEAVVGPAYTAHNFRYATGASYSGTTGNLTLNLSSLPYSTIYDMALQVQSCSEAGINKPCLVQYILSSTSSIALYQQTLTSALGAGNTWAAENAHCCVAVHGPPIGNGGAFAMPGGKQSGETLTDEPSFDINAGIQFDANLRNSFLVEHTAAGLHSSREVAQAWASIGVRSGGGAFDILDTGTRNRCTGTSRPGVGICELTFLNPWVLDAQPFVSTDFQRLNGGTEIDVYNSVTPRSFITTTTIRVYMYKYTAGSPGSWARADTDFFVAIHAGY